MEHEHACDAGRCRGCKSCAGTVSAGFDRCRVCAASAAWRRARGLEPVPVHAMEQGLLGGEVAERLRWYKDADDETVRQRLSLGLAVDVAGWITARRSLIDDVDVVTCPPSIRRAAPESIVDSVPSLVSRHRRLLGATGPVGRCHDPTAFDVDSMASGLRVLVFDDAFVSGATALSAADSLTGAGADVRAIVVIGRLIRPARATGAEIAA